MGSNPSSDGVFCQLRPVTVCPCNLFCKEMIIQFVLGEVFRAKMRRLYGPLVWYSASTHLCRYLGVEDCSWQVVLLAFMSWLRYHFISHLPLRRLLSPISGSTLGGPVQCKMPPLLTRSFRETRWLCWSLKYFQAKALMLTADFWSV